MAKEKAMAEQQHDLFEGRRLRDVAVDLVQTPAADYPTLALGVAVAIARRKGWVTSDDVMRECPPPDSADRRILGAVFRPQSRDFPLRKSGRYIQNTQPQAHARPIAVWVLK
jgi:hypothetical protein